MKEQLKKQREKKRKKVTNCSNYDYYSPKVDPPHQQVLVSIPREVVVVNDSSLLRNDSSLLRTFHTSKKKTKSYLEIAKEKILGRKD